MPGPHRQEIHLKPGPTLGAPFECCLWSGNKPGEWRSSGLTLESEFYPKTHFTFRELLSNFEQHKDINEFIGPLETSALKSLGNMLNSAVVPKGCKLDEDWIHIVPESMPKEAARDVRERHQAFLDFVLRIPWAVLTDNDSVDPQFLLQHGAKPRVMTVDAASKPGWEPLFPVVKLPRHPRVLLIQGCSTLST